MRVRTEPLEHEENADALHARAKEPEPPGGVSNTPLEIVIVTYGRPDLVIRCLQSVTENALAGTRVHVIDNHSPDETPDVVARAYPEVLLTRRQTNDGFAVANNVALAKVEAPYVLVLNPDTELASGVIEHALKAMDDDPTIGVLGCRLITADGTLDHAAKRMLPSPVTALRYFLLRLVGKTGSAYIAPHVDEFGIGDVDAVNGAFMLIRTTAMREVGTFDESYWMYAEDLDWCLRFREAGWRVVYDGRVTARHLKGGSSGSARSLRLNYHFHRSMAIFYRRRMPSGNRLLDALVTAGIWARFCLVSAVDAVRRLYARLSGSPA